jgi:Flp pilus assembly protein TadB
MIALVAVAWGVCAGGAVLGLAQRAAVTRRARAMRPGAPRRDPWRGLRRVAHQPRLRMLARVFGAPVRRRRAQRADEALRAELPIAVDLVGVAMGAGCTAYHAVDVAARWSPSRVAAVLDDVGRDVALGESFDAALRDAGDRAPSVRRLTDALRTSGRLGSPTLPALARLAQEVRADVRRRAEARARTVPVRLLFPLVFFILPAFALLTVVPVLLDGISF